MAAARRAATPQGSATTARRGRLSERAWADVRRAARLARAEGITLKVHGVEITGVLKQPQVAKTRTKRKAQQRPAETAASEQPSTVADEASPPPLSKRKQRSAQRLLEFQEKKRAAMLVRYEGRQDVVERLERKRLERIASSKAACVQQAAPVPDAEPMEAEGDGTAKRARLISSHPEAQGGMG